MDMQAADVFFAAVGGAGGAVAMLMALKTDVAQLMERTKNQDQTLERIEKKVDQAHLRVDYIMRKGGAKGVNQADSELAELGR